MEIDPKRLRISPVQLGARPLANEPDRWILTAPGRQELSLECIDVDSEVFIATIRIAELLSEEQSYQLAAALTLNRDQDALKGGAVAYDLDGNGFLYCKRIEAGALVLAMFDQQINEIFAIARRLSERMRQAQQCIRPVAPANSAARRY